MKKLIKNTDFMLFTAIMILVILGIVGIYSAGYNTEFNKTEWIKQIIWTAIGIILMAIVWLLDYNFTANTSFVLYPIFIIFLILVLFTPKINGASSWFDLKFFNFQPSEIMKIIYILTFAKFLDYISKQDKKGINKWYNMLFALIILIVPVILICMQPDFGTAIVYILITLIMMFKANLKYRYIVLMILLVILLLPLIYFFVLNNIQQERILVYFDPMRDPLGSGYNAIQSKTAIGSGMLAGTGILNGVQTQYGYLPIKSSDFIFSVISEELGFFASISIIIIYIFVFYRIIKISKGSKENLGSLITIGIFAMIFFHFIENIGMTMGLLPITGIPLCFVSYGGSSMLTNFLALGLLLSISARKNTGFFN